MKIAIGADHAGFDLKERLKGYLTARGHEVLDMGTSSSESTDYPAYAFLVAEAVRDGAAAQGLLVCDSGNGIAIAANKVDGIRAAIAIDPDHAALARRHNDANVLVLGAKILPREAEEPTLDAWLGAAFEGGRHARRVGQITDYERTHQRSGT
ncbi:MAG: ribose 5-phosphate isomerase B [Candidatus Eisenbacteria bacterium]